MTVATRVSDRGESTRGSALSFIYHESFEEPDAERWYGGRLTPPGEANYDFMPDETTRTCAKRMHYAAWRTSRAETSRESSRWQRRYYQCRDLIVLGNRKLTFRAVRKWNPAVQFADDMAAECQIVLIKAVAAFNPWLGIRFSTYAFTCIMRALSRMSKRQNADRLSHALPLDVLPFGEPFHSFPLELPNPGISALEKYLRVEDTLLSEREKSVLLRRYHLRDDGSRTETLEQVGRDLGLSKERVRQVQKSALEKLRYALLGSP